MEAHVAFQADEVLGPDLFNLLLLCIRSDPFELCLRPALCTFTHGSPLILSLDGGTNADERRVPPRTWSIRFANDLRDAEPRRPKESPPHREWEEAQTMVVRLHPQATPVANQVDERGLVRRVRWIRIVLVLDQDDLDVPAARDRAGRRVLSERGRSSFDVREEHATRCQVHERGSEGRAQLSIRPHVGDGVRDHHGVEPPPEADRAHVPDPVCHLWIQTTREREHGGAEIDAGDLEGLLQGLVEMTAATSQMEELAGSGGEPTNQSATCLGLPDVAPGGADDRPCPRKVVVEPAFFAGAFH